MSENTVVLPTCRVIGGSLYSATPDVTNGQPRLGRDGKQTSTYSFGVAIPKNIPGFRENNRDWANTPWGAVIWRIGHEAWPGMADSPTFAWKVKDGDTPYPNENGTILKDSEGCAGHWVLWLATKIKPVVCTVTGEIIPDGHPNSIYAGCYVQVQINVAGNKPNPENKQHKAGVYLNPMCVAFVAHGIKIETATRVDPKAAGFTPVDPSQLPPGASLTPVAPQFNPAPVPQQSPSPAQQQAPSPYSPPAAAPVPGPYAPPVQPAHVMTALAQYPYEAYIAAGWNDDQLRSNGLML